MNSLEEHQQGVCPNCGSNNLQYDVLEVVDDQVMYPWTCNHCLTTGEEWYLLQFTNHEEIEIPKENE